MIDEAPGHGLEQEVAAQLQVEVVEADVDLLHAGAGDDALEARHGSGGLHQGHQADAAFLGHQPGARHLGGMADHRQHHQIGALGRALADFLGGSGVEGIDS
jgi:hypothetical protein